MKKSGNILDMLKKHEQNNVTCPACGIILSKLKLNAHLDFDCSSSLDDFAPNKQRFKALPENKIESTDSKSLEKRNLSKASKAKLFPENEIKLTGSKSLEKQSHDHTSKAQKPLPENNINSTGSKSLEKRSHAHTSKAQNDFSPNDQDKMFNDKIEKIQTTKPAYNTSAPWRSQSTKRKFSNVSPIKKKVVQQISKQSSSEAQLDQCEIIVLDDTQISDNCWIQSINHSKASEPVINSNDSTSFSELLNDDFTELLKDSQNPSQNLENQQTFSPYYLANFKHVLDKVLDDEFNKHLFNDEDKHFVKIFQQLSDNAQKLYVRLFQRKYKWLRPSQMNYSQIAQDLTVHLEELVHHCLLDSGSQNMELEVALNLLSLPEMKTLSKCFNFNASGKSKVEIKEILIKHAKQHKSFFFSSGKNSVTMAMLKKVLQVLGPCYILKLEPKQLFTRILMLFSLPTMSEDDEEAAGGQQQQLLTLLQVNKGELKFPQYNICREYMIFEHRDDLIRYEVARQLENDIIHAIELKKFDEAKDFYLQADKQLTEFQSTELLQSFYRDKNLPQHLRRYTAGHVYVRCLNQGVEVLQKLRQYDEAVELIQRLLKQTVYCQDRRGKWWDRLALNLDQHLKRPQEVSSVIKKALSDKYVRVGPRLSLLTRAKRILNSKCEDKELEEEYLQEMHNIVEAPKVTIRGRLLPRPIPGRRHIFISSNSTDNASEEDVNVISVEQLAIEHYKNSHYTEGVHGEGSTFISIYALLFWDIIYDGSIPDVFISPYQMHPLDLNSEDYYDRRKSQIDNQLETIRNHDIEDILEIVQSTWACHVGESSLVNWEIFTSVEHIMGLITCLGSSLLAGICERLAKDFRFTRSGVPDLVVWNPDTKLVKIVEVKGPGDKLSTKQIMWLDYLIKLGAEAEVCLVEAVGSKKLKRN